VHVTARRPALVLIASLAVLGLFAPRLARAQASTKQQCIAAYTDAQHDRQSGKLLKARAELRICASDPCPAVLQSDCSPWLGEVDRLVPSVVFAARDTEGRDLLDVSVAIDGQVVVSRLDGRPIDVDPGEHLLRFEAPDHAVTEQRVLFREGEKVRSLSVTLGPAAQALPEPKTEATVGWSRPIPATVWIFGGVGVAGLATVATTALVGLPTWNRCHEGGCTASDRSFSDTLNTVGDVALAVGAVGVAAAAYFFLTRPAISLEPHVSPHAAALHLRASF
jgi:hypothetical protein